MSRDILGSLVRALVTVPENRLGLVQDLALKLASGNGADWETKSKAFLWGEPITETTLSYLMLKVVAVHTDQDVLPGAEFQVRSKLASSGKSDQTAFDFYSKRGNWHLIPEYIEVGGQRIKVEVIVFPDTEFTSGGRRCVRFLYRYGAEWRQDGGWVGHDFGRYYLVAVVAS